MSQETATVTTYQIAVPLRWDNEVRQAFYRMPMKRTGAIYERDKNRVWFTVSGIQSESDIADWFKAIGLKEDQFTITVKS